MPETLLPGDIRRSLAISLLRAREAVMGRFRPMLARHDVTEQQWRVLRVLGEGAPCDASELAERACILAPSLTRIIRALEERGMITREKHGGDGRRVRLAIAPKGLALIRDVAPESRAIYAELETRYGAEKVERLLGLLNELADLRDES
jgi:homoprotocatechuate degradation regulator HpaR